MQGIPGCIFLSAQGKRRTQKRDGFRADPLELRVFCHHLLQFCCEHGADARLALSGYGPGSFEKLLIDGDCDVLLHPRAILSLHT